MHGPGYWLHRTTKHLSVKVIGLFGFWFYWKKLVGFLLWDYILKHMVFCFFNHFCPIRVKARTASRVNCCQSWETISLIKIKYRCNENLFHYIKVNICFSVFSVPFISNLFPSILVKHHHQCRHAQEGRIQAFR